MEIIDLMNKKVKISKCSITVKDDKDKTCGVVRDITTMENIQANRKFEYASKMRKDGISTMSIGLKNIVIKDNTLYFFRNIKHKLFLLEAMEKHPEVFAEEWENEQKKETMYKNISDAGYQVIECIFI